MLDELISPICSSPSLLGVLGAARYVVFGHIRKLNLKKDLTKVLADFENFLHQCIVVEPTEDEQTLAADFELAAQREGINLHSGESQLCAITISRIVPWLLTGDKQAIKAIEKLLDVDSRLLALTRKVMCLEQLVLYLLNQGQRITVRETICAEPEVDKTLTICFCCNNQNPIEESFSEGLKSYIADLRTQASRILVF